MRTPLASIAGARGSVRLPELDNLAGRDGATELSAPARRSISPFECLPLFGAQSYLRSEGRARQTRRPETVAQCFL
jgi:hypothetical protein